MTDALLFTWEELRGRSLGGGEGEGPSDHSPELRVVEYGSRICPSDLTSSRVPKVGHAALDDWACLVGVSGGCSLITLHFLLTFVCVFKGHH